jgi:phenylacetyl-CoA:acceptor oxidoreductase 26-kDa subunit
MSFGPNPWQQTSWDARAAGNFIGGGAGCGLLVFTWLASAQGSLRAVLIVLALALVSLGLLCVWAEIGRPWRSINVIFNPRTSWMSREAALAPLLLGSGALALFGVDAALPLAALLALGFVYCQARILQAAKGIPAWREPLMVPLLVATGLAEGAGLYWLFVPWWGQGTQVLWLVFGVLLALRFVLGLLWTRRLTRALRPRSLQAVMRAVLALNAGSLLPLAIVLVVLVELAAPLPPGWQALLQALAGAMAAIGGAAFKFLLVTRAGFNQGFALPHLPVRGVRR